MSMLDNARAMRRLLEIQARTTAPDMNASDVITVRAFLSPWTQGAYSAGDVCVYHDQPWKCAQAHDSTGNPGWNPVEAHSLWFPYHGTTPEAAMPYVPPTGAHDAYQDGEYAVENGTIYRCKTNAVVWPPSILPSAWEIAV